MQEDEDVQHHSFTTFVYDEADHVILQEEKNYEDELVSKITRKFDEAGSLTDSEVEIAGGLYRAPQEYMVRYETSYF